LSARRTPPPQPTIDDWRRDDNFFSFRKTAHAGALCV